MNKLGKIKIVSFNYSQYSSRYDAFKEGRLAPVFDINKEGGALADLNIYNLHLLVDLFGKPEKIYYHPNIEKSIDTSGILNLDYKDFKAIAIGAKDSRAPLTSTIQADSGTIVINGPTNEIKSFDLLLKDEKPVRVNLQKDNKHRLYYEFVEFEKIIRTRDYKKDQILLNHSMEVIELMTEARKSAGIIYPSDKN